MPPSSPQPAADRNLLFGILALQMDFVSRDALVKGMNAWVLEKAKPLGQVLVEQGALGRDEHALLEPLVHKHLERHGNDAEKSLAAVSSLGSVREELKQIADPAVQASLAHVSQGHPQEGEDPWATRMPAVGTPTSSGLRFRILRPHARGGLGAVFVAHDEELHREVALKEIQDKHADHPESRARFLLEAEITGGLEHPGIVPVYGLGKYPDGRPFYAMRFIKGDSLKEAIERFHKAEVPGRDVGERALAFRQLLGRFVDVCNAIAYAHSRGVLHRDLKPGNVMLGPYGETLVVDWGLAKAVGKRGEPPASAAGAEEPTLWPTSASGSAPTQMGDAIGTPQFMPPEQAAGRLDELGPASDVYSLGATLYCLLTGKAPFQIEDVGALLLKVQRGEYRAPRQIKPGVPAALEAVCQKAMALRPGDRYISPRVLADEIEHWLADEPVSACPERMTVKAGRWMRRHKPVVSGAAAAVVVGLIALTAGVVWYQEEQADRERDRIVRAAQAEQKRLLAEQGIGQALDQAQAVRDDLQKKLRQRGGVFALLNHPEDWQARIKMAQAGLDRARALLASAEEGMDPALTGRAGQLERMLQEDEADRLLAVRLEKIRLDRATLVEGKFDFKKAGAEYPRAFGDAGLEVMSSDRAGLVRRILTMPIKEEVVAALDDWALVAFALGNKELPERLLTVARHVAPDPTWGDRLRQLKTWRNQEALTTLVRKGPAGGLSPQLLVLVGAMSVVDNPSRQTWLRQAQARFPADFWLNFYLAVALQENHPVEAAGFYRVALALRPATSVAYNNLGVVLGVQKKLPEAIAAFHNAIALDPKFAFPHNNLGNALHAEQKLPEAIAAFHNAIALDPKYAAAYYNLGNAFRDQKKLPKAIAAYRNAIARDPNQAKAYHELGASLYDLQKLPEAIAAYRNAIALNPKDGTAYNNLAIALFDQQKLPEAIAAYHKAIELDPKNAKVYNNLGNGLRAQQKLPEAIAAYHKAIELDPKLATAHNNLGISYHYQNKLPEAIAAFRKAIALDPKSAKAFNNLGTALHAQHKLPEAISAYHRAIALDAKNAGSYQNLGLALYTQQRLPEAISAFRKAIEVNPIYAEAHCHLGHTLLAQGEMVQGLAALQRGDELGRRRGEWRYPSAEWVRNAERLAKLERNLPAILSGKQQPAGAGERIQYAQVCHPKGLYAAEARFYEQAFAADPKLAEDLKTGNRYNAACAACLSAAGQGKDAAKLDDKERAHWRRQAVAWLKADLALWAKLESGKPQDRATVQQTLSHWQKDADLAGIRDKEAVAKLLAADQAACNALWAEVAALLKKAAGKP